MAKNQQLTASFEQHRARLRGVAYRMLGSLSDADDAVQEAWLRLNRADAGEVENLGGWLTTVVARVCLDMLRSRKTRQEESIDEADGVRAAASSTVAGRTHAVDPEQEALLAESVGLVMAPGGRLQRVVRMRIAGGRIASVDIVADPAMLRAIEVAALE